jgi:hypothetical protein
MLIGNTSNGIRHPRTDSRRPTAEFVDAGTSLAATDIFRINAVIPRENPSCCPKNKHPHPAG